MNGPTWMAGPWAWLDGWPLGLAGWSSLLTGPHYWLDGCPSGLADGQALGPAWSFGLAGWLALVHALAGWPLPWLADPCPGWLTLTLAGQPLPLLAGTRVCLASPWASQEKGRADK